MDESWRMRMGMTDKKPAVPRRRSTEDHSRRKVLEESDTLDPDDFKDVFGGPPRSVLHRQFSGGFGISGRDFFYQEVFKLPEDGGSVRSGRNLPEFRIPVSRDGTGRRSEEFYSDIFGKDVEDLRRSRSRSKNSKSKSKSNCSSVLSSEDFSPFRPAVTDDDISFASFASKLRPINVPPKWNSIPTKQEVLAQQKEVQHSPYRNFVENEYLNNLRSSQFGLSQRPSSPETSNVEQHSYKLSAADDLELNSPSSMLSSVCHENQENGATNKMDGQDSLDDDDDDEIMSSYVIEINSDRRGDPLNVDDAIAWAKEKFQTKSAKDYSAESEERDEGKIVGRGSTHLPADAKKWNTEEEKQQLEKDIEMELLSEDIRMWSYGKEANIQLLLSSLHLITWPRSGWNQISIVNLQESSNLKKAYQKARLCLHPDKLQQRGATMQQKYIAEKAFPILQDAWSAFISQEASL